MIEVELSKRGEIVIPKKVRDSIGWKPHKRLTMEWKGKEIVLRPATGGEDIIKWFEDTAKRINADVSKWKTGDALYEEEFGR